MFIREITHWFARRSFQNRIFLLILFTSTIVMLAITWYLTDITKERLHYQVGQRALIQAMQISAMPELVEAVEAHDLPRIKALIDPMRSFSDATYITVGNEKGQRLYHVNPNEIGKYMEGGDSDDALYNAKSYVSVRKGSLGSSLRGKSPIQDSTGKVIGIVSVGYTLEQLESWLNLQISSLLFLKRYDNALALIQQQSESHQKVLDFISHNFRDHHLAGLLIGKYYRAKELGLELIFDPSSFVEHLPSSLSHNEWISIVGNLLDNAYNATLLNREGSRQIECLINSEGNEVIIEVADQGCGIDENIRQHIFERGVTTHNNGDHGIGLWLVHSYVKQANGDIIVDNNNPFGTIFTLYIPFTREE
ncbi:sensor histidine kinase [Salmonella enterica subsp. enterica serovar Bredeney]|nr:sensor histidine kinase [Salmonella enterica subsp. enterica serovar Bredeney]EEI9358650.1 sensor histidine kinase [Salmonella enterica subsp. enterica serovar Bredeney]